ncbi:MAG: Fis family transcriptional regulator, partial [Selenomonadaceae bacterium]
ESFIERIAQQVQKPVRGITPEALEILMAYKWPGNVRELENIIERVITLMDSDFISRDNLPTYLTGETVAREVKNFDPNVVLPWAEYEKQIIANALKKCGSFNAAGKMLKLTHKTVATKAKKYGLV